MNKKLFGLLVGLSVGACSSMQAMEEVSEYLHEANKVKPITIALFRAVDANNYSCLRKLLEYPNANVRVLNGCDSESLLHKAVRKDNAAMVKLLLEAKAAVNAFDDNCDTPLHFAVRVGNVHIVRMLLEKGADLGAKGSDDLTPYELAERVVENSIALSDRYDRNKGFGHLEGLEILHHRLDGHRRVLDYLQRWIDAHPTCWETFGLSDQFNPNKFAPDPKYDAERLEAAIKCLQIFNKNIN